ncbi:hypothetical protein Tco_1022536 [Tanacetum coccineum]
MNESELNNIHMNESEVVHNVFNCKESNVDDNPVNNIFKIGKGFHAVPPPYTGNYMPPRPDLSFAGLDKFVFKVNNVTTIGPKAVVSAAMENEEMLLSPQHAGFGDQQEMLLTIPLKTVDHTCLKDLNMLIYKADSNYQEIDGGFVAFGGSPKGGKITGKENSVLFTKTECLVLSPDFKLLDESQVLLKVPRQNNMYSFDLKNVVPSGEDCLQRFLKMTILVLLVIRESNTKPLVRPSL